MTATITIDGTQSTLIIEYTALKEKVNSTADDAVHCLFDRNFLGSKIEIIEDIEGGSTKSDWEDVTTAQKLSILDDYVKKTILGLAKQYYIDDAKSDAQVIAETEIETKYIGE